MTVRNPVKDQVAIVGIGSTGFTRTNERSALALGLEAATRAIRDAGLRAADVDGLVAIAEPGAPSPAMFASSLGLDTLTHWTRPAPVVTFAIVDAVNAIHSGSADTVLVVSSMLRLPWASRSAASDPFRRRLATGVQSVPEDVGMATAYTAWASRYLHEHGVTRDGWGRIAVNARTNALRNPLAAMRTPITLDDYGAARMIRDPLCMLDMDLPVDGADAFVLTSAERAKTLPHPPVLVHAIATGMVGEAPEDQLASLRRHGQHVVVEQLKAKSDFWIDDVDVYYPYDGFTIITAGWIENTGWCKPGKAGRFLRDHWVDAENRALIRGRVPINSHGGSLSEGGTRGTGHIREAVLQLRGEAGERQVHGARTALVTPGGFFFNSQGAMLRRA
jgi:acetyl-CoA acetyltransferase